MRTRFALRQQFAALVPGRCGVIRRVRSAVQVRCQGQRRGLGKQISDQQAGVARLGQVHMQLNQFQGRGTCIEKGLARLDRPPDHLLEMPAQCLNQGVIGPQRRGRD